MERKWYLEQARETINTENPFPEITKLNYPQLNFMLGNMLGAILCILDYLEEIEKCTSE